MGGKKQMDGMELMLHTQEIALNYIEKLKKNANKNI